MKTFKNLIVNLFLFLTVSSCDKSTADAGLVGPQGAIGPQGAKGDAGAIGPQGVKGDAGAIGPQGAKGDPGVAGANGANGVTGATGATGAKGATGNSNVTQFKYGSVVYVGNEIAYDLAGFSENTILNSAIIVYVKYLNSTLWSTLPGYSFSGNQYRITINTRPDNSPNVPKLYIWRVSGTVNETFQETRILIIPNNTISGARKENINMTDYEAVKRYFKLKD
jgi:Collagen triple helix repeat (20 copies)